MPIWSILCHTANKENYQMTDAANNDKNSHKTCPSGDPKFMSEICFAKHAPDTLF